MKTLDKLKGGTNKVLASVGLFLTAISLPLPIIQLVDYIHPEIKSLINTDGILGNFYGIIGRIPGLNTLPEWGVLVLFISLIVLYYIAYYYINVHKLQDDYRDFAAGMTVDEIKAGATELNALEAVVSVGGMLFVNLGGPFLLASLFSGPVGWGVAIGSMVLGVVAIIAGSMSQQQRESEAAALAEAETRRLRAELQVRVDNLVTVITRREIGKIALSVCGAIIILALNYGIPFVWPSCPSLKM